MTDTMPNADAATVEQFGLQWRDFDQSQVPSWELERIFDKYFDHFSWARLGDNATGMDAGCGSGRWAMFVAPRVGRLICVDASAGAAAVAQKRLQPFENCEVHACPLQEAPVADGSLDFAYCLGVLHYVPDPRAALSAIVRKLKPGAQLLLYVYYALENRPGWFRKFFRFADWVRRGIARTPYGVRRVASDILAVTVYLPLARLAYLLEKLKFNVKNIPLAAYRDRSFYTMRTDCLDRFGNHLEHRFTRKQLHELLEEAGMTNIVIPTDEPYWRAVAEKSN